MSRFGRNQGSVLQDWVTKLPLRYQGILISYTRGCDNVNKEDFNKHFIRVYRGLVLNAPSEKPSSFIEYASDEEKRIRFDLMIKDSDHLPHHYIVHLIHAIEIIGYEYPGELTRELFKSFYLKACSRLHMNPETAGELEARLTCEFKENQ